jgi:hypothetical protein
MKNRQIVTSQWDASNQLMCFYLCLNPKEVYITFLFSYNKPVRGTTGAVQKIVI